MRPRCFRIWFFAALVVIVAPAAGLSQVQRGLAVEDILKDSAAAKAGLRLGDRIVAYDGRPLPSPAALQAAEENTVGKDAVILSVQRGDETLMLGAPAGNLGIQARPYLPLAALTLYEEGRAAQAAQKTEETITRWEAAAKAAQEAGDSESAAWLHGRVGGIYETQRQWKEASEAHMAAWKLLEQSSDPPARSRALSALGRCSQNVNDFPAAQRWYEQAAQADTAAGNERWAAGDLNTLGSVALSRGDLTAAQDYYSRAFSIRERLAPNSLDVGASLNNLGIVARFRGDLAGAQDYFSRSLTVRERLAPNSLDVANGLNNLGVVAGYRGDLAAAQDYFGRALTIIERLAPNSLDVASSLNNMGIVARSRGNFAAAQEYHSRALAIKERLAPNSLDVAASLNNLGEVARNRGDFAAAQEYHSRALAIKERLAPNSLTVSNSLNNLGDVARNRGDLAAAQDYQNRALAIKEQLAPNSLTVANSLESLGHIAGTRGDLTAAQDYHRRALTVRERLAPNSLEVAWSLASLGDVGLKQRRFSDALPLFTRAVDIVEVQRWQIHTTEARALLLAQYTESYIGLLRAHVALHNLPAAFATAERARARSLLEILNEGRAEIRQGVDPQLLEREHSLQQQLNAKADRQTQLLSGPHTDDQAAAAKKELDSLLVQYQDIQAQIRLKSPHYAALTQPQPFGLEEIQQQVVDGNTLLLEYVLGEEISYLFAVTRDSIRAFELPGRAEIEHSARRVAELLMARQPVRGESQKIRQARINKADAEYPAASAALSQMVLGPVAGLLSSQRLLIVADGALQVIPFGALPVPAKAMFLIVNHEIVNLPSASVLAVQRRELGGRRPAPKQVAVLADPVFDFQDPRLKRNRQAVRSAELVDDRGALSRLPFTREEADTILALAPAGQGMKAVDFKANRATVTSADLSQYRIVHLATHGLLDTERPELSGIVLSQVDEQGKPQDGFLRLHEVYNLNWSADLVVLSACQTALGKEIRGEGLVGLARGFMYAGAKGVLASLWNVNDSATALFMKQFYQGMFAKGLPPAAALRAAQVEMSKRNPWRSPYYWSAFVLQGDWR